MDQRDAKIFVTSRTIYGDVASGFELYRFVPGILFSMKNKAFDPTEFPSVLRDMETKIVPYLRFRRPDEIPNEPGFCIKDGFIADDGKTPQYEYAKLFFRFKQWPDVNVSVTATRSGKIHPSLLERVHSKPIPLEFAEAAKEVKTFREGKHDIGPLKGEEILEALPTDHGFFIHRFVWDTRGKANSAIEPAFYFELQTGVAGAQDVRPSLTDKEAIELFDAIVNSIRLRPTTPGKSSDAGNNPKFDSGEAQRLPLGTQVSSLRSCPETGVYECAAGVQGVTERRVLVQQGRPMPSALAKQVKSGISGLLGSHEAKEIEIMWTLISHEKKAS